MNSQDFRNLQEAYLGVYDNIMEKENSEYEKASDAALDARFGYGRASGDKRSFGRAANRSSAAAALRALRRGERSGSGTSTKAGSDAVHQGWARTARTSADQTPEKKERRAVLANTPYSKLPKDEQEKDTVSFNAVKAVYNRNKTQKEETDLYDIILSHLLDEGYAETQEQAEVIMVNMSEDWREDIVEKTAMAKRGYDETEIRTKIANSTGGGSFADKATALADQPTYGDSGKQKARENLARKQRGDFRNTTSSSPGLHGYGHKSNDPAVKAKQAARGAQRGALTPNEKKQFGR
jgi:hypothetical protein